MKFLLDTHTFLWMLQAPGRLSPKARTILENHSLTVVFSAASAWEIAIKWRLHKLVLPSDPEHFLPEVVRERGLAQLGIDIRHAGREATLRGAHQDPFDRMLAAQALVEEIPIVTQDKALKKLGAEVIW